MALRFKRRKIMGKEFEKALAKEITTNKYTYIVGENLCMVFDTCDDCPAGDGPDEGCGEKLGEMAREWAEGVNRD
jgi:hypothetical protein